MKNRLLLGAAIAIMVTALLIGGAVFLPRSVINRIVNGAVNDSTALLDRSREFNAAVRAGNTARIYALFNSTFRREISFPRFDRAVRDWLKDRPVRNITITHQERHGLSGMTSTHVYFDDPADTLSRDPGARRGRPDEYEFVFQYWLRNPEGWQLMWLSRVLDPVTMDYGHEDVAAMQQTMALALEEVVNREGLDSVFGLDTRSVRVVMVRRSDRPLEIPHPNLDVVWMNEQDILKHPDNRRLAFYIDAPLPRVMRDVAVASLDIVPVYHLGDSAAPGRRRGIKLFFIRSDGEWRFADYGSMW